MEGLAHAVMVRAPCPHARLGPVDGRAAAAMPGVLRVITAADVAAAGFGVLEPRSRVTSPDGTPMRHPPRPLLAGDRVRHAGEAVAVVVAETVAQARDAAEQVQVDWEELPAVTDVRRGRTFKK